MASGRVDVLLHPPVQGGGVITHGDQLTLAHVGPWSLQGVDPGAEVLQELDGPGRGFWRFDTPDEFLPPGTWPADADDEHPDVLNDAGLLGGVVTGSPVIVDGYSVAVGTRIVQWAQFPDNYDFLAQGTGLKVLFRGCRFRWSVGVGGAGIFNDNGATSQQQVMLHYPDLGLLSLNPAAGEGLMHIKHLGGTGHRVLRAFHTYSAAFYQPNAVGCEYVENWVDGYVYLYGEKGTSGSGPDSTTYHLNGLSTEGGQTALKILRNRILCASPDGADGSNGSTAGQRGYGTQPGQVGYGTGTNPGRLTVQTDNIAVFSSNGQPNLGDGSTGIQIRDNYVGGSGVCIYAANSLGNATNVKVTGNKVTTRFWEQGGSVGPATDLPVDGVNGCEVTGNTWADDYGTAASPGSTALADRQYPAGNGPRVGTEAF